MLPSHKIKIAIFDSYVLWLAAYDTCGAFLSVLCVIQPPKSIAVDIAIM